MMVFQGGDDGRGFRNVHETSRGCNLKERPDVCDARDVGSLWPYGPLRSPRVLEEVAATSTKLGTVRYTRGRARVAPAAL
jgi:hypothetical protein